MSARKKLNTFPQICKLSTIATIRNKKYFLLIKKCLGYAQNCQQTEALHHDFEKRNKIKK